MILRRFASSLLHLFAVGAALAVLSARAADNDALEKRYQEANAKVDAGEFQPALDIYNEILEAEPAAGNVWVMRAIAKWKLKDQSGARADLAQAIKLHPDNLDAYRVRGQMRYEAKDYAGSRADFDKAIDLVERVVKANAGDEDAEEEALLFHQANAELYGMRAEVARMQEDNLSALRDLTRAVQLKSDYPAAFYLRGQIYEAEGRPAEAESDYSRTIELEPAHADAFNQRGWLRFHRTAWTDALADARRVLELAPKAAVAGRLAGYCLFAQGDYRAAADQLAAAIEGVSTPNDVAYALFVRHFALQRLGATDKRLAATWENWKNERWLQALAKFITGQIDEEALEEAAKQAGDDDELLGQACEMHFYIALMRLKAGDKSTARLRFQSAIATDKTTFIEHALAQAELKRLARP
jgi:lipoprotein NlpI